MINRTSPTHDFLRVARQRNTPIFGIYVELFCVGAKIFDERPEHTSADCPFVLCGVLVEESMHNFNRFIRESIRFDDTFQSDPFLVKCASKRSFDVPCLHIILITRRHSVLSG